MSNDIRVPGGRPTGGEFASHDRGAADITLTPETNWGNTGVSEGSRSPWGTVDYSTDIAPGITSVGTPGHGGIKLSAERNREIPFALRNRNAWYEEDCEYAIVGMNFPDAFPNQDRESFERTVKNYFPDGWEAATSGTVAPGESGERDRLAFQAAHADEFLGRSAAIDPDNDKFVIVTARRGDGWEARFRVPRAESKAQREQSAQGQEGRFLVDESRHERLPEEPAAILIPSVRFGIADIAPALTTAAKNKLSKDLNKRWRMSDGTVKTMAQIIGDEGVTGKSAMLEVPGKRSYYLTQRANVGDSSSTIYPVAKSTWDLVGAPDERSARQVAYQDLQIAEDARDKASTWDERLRARDRIKVLEAALESAREAEARV